ncbi:MAG: MarR family transcriptional regulator [Dehalococcoidia bacterium]|nr:MarR family transcriptional regulator [Dehalococcoidia bacterium]
MNRDLEPHVIAAWQAMARTVGSLMKSLDEELQRTHGLTLSYFDVLEELTNAPGERLRMQQLADAVMLSRSGLTRLIDRMENAGLVQREPFPADRRGYYAMATEEGKRLYLQARPVKAQTILQRFGSHLDYSDLLGLSGALRKVMVANDLL